MKFVLRQLEVLVAVVQWESISRAAEGLSLSQSVTSTSLSELEQQFNCKPLGRTGRRLALNAFGRQLLPQAVVLLDRGEETENLLNGKTTSGSLDLGTTLAIGNHLATLLIGAFMQRQPDRRVRLHAHSTARVVQQVVHYELDLGLIEGDCRHPDIEVQPWMEDELVVFYAPQYPPARWGDADLERLMREAWIFREQGSGTRPIFDQAMRRRLRSLNIRLELEYTEAIKRAVESGLGIDCISRLALRDAFRRDSLVPVETPDPDLHRQFCSIWHEQKYQTATMREFLDLCRGEIARISRSDEIVLPLVP